jgi:hypothetical protein
MRIIGSKAEGCLLLKSILETNEFKNRNFIDQFHKRILKKKIRFPVLEYIAKELFGSIPDKYQLIFTKEITELNEIGGNVIAGIILQLRLEKHFQESLSVAVKYIISGDQWFVCDIIGERVMGCALLFYPEKTIPVLNKFINHSDKWIVRCVGVATHYAVKKGLKKVYSERLFQILLSCSAATDFHSKKGIGWAAKTVAKFHPDIIKKYQVRIENNSEVKQWFKTKIKIGLSRSYKYASRYPG